MVHDGHAADDPGTTPATSTETRTDRPLARSVETTPEALYVWQIAVLEARLDAEEARVERAERDCQYVIDRYEELLDDRATGELYADGGRTTDRERSNGSTVAKRALDSVRSLL
jgi:hypothetical protein